MSKLLLHVYRSHSLAENVCPSRDGMRVGFLIKSLKYHDHETRAVGYYSLINKTDQPTSLESAPVPQGLQHERCNGINIEVINLERFLYLNEDRRSLSRGLEFNLLD